MAAFKNGSPLVVGIGKFGNFVSSDIPALLSETNKIVYLEENAGVSLSKGEIRIVDAKSGKGEKSNIEEIDMEEIKEDRAGFPHFMRSHFMIKGISEQPEVIARIANNSKKEMSGIVRMIKGAWGTYFTACGTAGYAGLAATYMFSGIAGRHINFSVASEFPYFEDFLVPKSLLIAASQSGETMDTLEAVRAAKRHKSKVLALVNVPGSTLARLADYSFMLKAGPERAVVSTKAYIAKLSSFLLLAFAIAGKYQKGVAILKKTRGFCQKCLNQLNLLKKLKNWVMNFQKRTTFILLGVE